MSLVKPPTHPVSTNTTSSNDRPGADPNSNSELTLTPLLPFFTRNNLTPADRRACDAAATRLHPDAVIRVFEHQGCCSYTLYVAFFSWSATHTSLLQFRPARFAVDVELVRQARQVYGECVPRVWEHGEVKLPTLRPSIAKVVAEEVENGKGKGKEERKGKVEKRVDEERTGREESGKEEEVKRARDTSEKPHQSRPHQLKIYEMDLLPGIPYTRLQARTETLDPDTYRRQLRLIRDFAAFIARGYHAAIRTSSSPSSSLSSHASAMTGKVGRQLTWKVARLGSTLPTAGLRTAAAAIAAQLPRLHATVPVVLNHGDMVAGNLLVDSASWELRGVVDWAEAEALPFGTCLYGLEGLLGYLAPRRRRGREGGITAEATDVRSVEWVYYECAAALRRAFWDALEEEIPALGEGEELREGVSLARDVGVLLWYGYAWDEGRIDRVVEWERDEAECVCLEAFLGVDEDTKKRAEAKL